ncbi:hypothetical protein BG53_05680 [Paenibacillus darwinianus]|uniref:Uncharacterized protein n=1 Tax=Paenibacillus darwinianus TaxID=1380763 RepID=A0A9W5W6G7_9BACL|nr:hypothetical protein [Paenibacillus darwinianus]EXX86668.1 hypothetical protein BG53_05680 [Paenibacillus darwinianus]EXX86959.1 hypothetical protein BG52_05250 [Paenibacillus darwinianus]EXX91924.1 hypothetical protein CH50_12610 [Paenibacillus darwinianus]
MRRKLQPWFIALIVLMGVGVVSQLIKNPVGLIIPVTVFAVVFLLYKFPPSRFRVSKPSARSAAPDRLKTKSRSRKTVPFRVIEGGKDDDNQPKYH